MSYHKDRVKVIHLSGPDPATGTPLLIGIYHSINEKLGVAYFSHLHWIIPFYTEIENGDDDVNLLGYRFDPYLWGFAIDTLTDNSARPLNMAHIISTQNARDDLISAFAMHINTMFHYSFQPKETVH